MRSFSPRNTFFGFLLLAATCCVDKTKRVVERWNDGTPKVVKNYYHRDTLHYQLATYYQDGVSKELIHFVGEFKNGWNITYFESGNVKDSIFLKNNTPFASSKHFYENGNLKAYGTYQDGKKDGPWDYYDSSGIIHEISFYNFGEKNGKTSIFNNEGWLIKEIEKYISGEIKEVFNYQDSLKHGDYIRLDKYGKYELSGKFNRGNKEGTRWITYHSSGKKFREIEYTSEHEWNALLVNLWDLDGIQTVENGNGYFRYNNYSDCNGKQIIESQTTLYYKNGKQSNKRVIARQDCP